MNLKAEAEKRKKWNTIKRNTWKDSLRAKISPGSKVVVVYMDGNLEPVKQGCIGIVFSIIDNEVKVYFPELERFCTKETPTTMYWYELDVIGITNPMEQHLRQVIAG